MAPTAERSGPFSPRSVVFRAEIGSVPHRDRSPRSSTSHSTVAVVDGDSAVATSAFLRTIWISWTISVGARTGAAQKHDGIARLRDAASPALRLVASNHGNTPPAGAVRRPRTRQNAPPEQPRAAPHCPLMHRNSHNEHQARRQRQSAHPMLHTAGGRASFLTAVSYLRAYSEYDHADSRTTARGRVRPRGAPVVRSPAGYWTRVARLLVEAGIPVRVGRRPTHPEMPVSCRNARFVVLATGRGAVGPISARN